MTAEQAWRPDVQHLPPAGETTAVLDALGLPHIFSPVEAAQLLRNAGLAEITECALKTRAYRKQVPFHLNGRRIVFTLDDLREIAEGEACRPAPCPGSHRSAIPPTSPSATFVTAAGSSASRRMAGPQTGRRRQPDSPNRR
jgi:hypothetical protein